MSKREQWVNRSAADSLECVNEENIMLGTLAALFSSLIQLCVLLDAMEQHLLFQAGAGLWVVCVGLR